MNYFGYPIINPFRSHVPRGFYHPVRGHTGIDIATPLGTPLSLPIETTVAKILTQPEMGLTLYLRDSVGNILVFSHLSEVLFNAGQVVEPGKVFARTGNSGSATTGPHLHFEVIADQAEPGLEMMSRHLAGFGSYNIDPVRYLDHLHKPHWSDAAMNWAKEEGYIAYERDPSQPVTWGEFVTILKRLAEK